MKIKIKISKKNTLFENYLYILRNVSSIKEKKKKKKKKKKEEEKEFNLTCFIR
jgi:hypothetical protein